ncbi:glycerol dehydrogenase [Salinigranum rubrum]|uniref:Glycerol dehydrogenase n=1 Tax=Salinigranum rubrum TaxID=755307 RepID=A0A2I8VEW0_9EURY|nr:glycerol dehydrogenase [Salinigranum rubrum]AUV80470.1 glycerol dehydrogenase [Salinigranum rubrum]
MSRVFKSPARYVQGRGVTAELGAHAETLGDSALLLADGVVLGLVEDEVTTSLEAQGVEVSTVTFGGECSTAEIDRVAGIAEERGVDIVVAAGGGKALDAAKAVRAERGGAMVSMPTIASTDAPTSALSVVYSEHGEFEEYLFHDDHPDLVLVDTAVVAAAPTRLFRGGVADALATWFEAAATSNSDGDNVVGGKPTRAGTHLAKLCYETLREHAVSAVEAVERDAVTESVEAVTEANTLLSGLGFESGGLAAAHSIHNGLTQLEATHGATHGEKVNVGTISQLVLEGRDDAFVEEIIEFSLDVGLPVTLAEVGLDDPTREQLDVVAEAACADEETIHNEPFAVEPAMVRDAILTADGLGERVRAER